MEVLFQGSNLFFTLALIGKLLLLLLPTLYYDGVRLNDWTVSFLLLFGLLVKWSPLPLTPYHEELLYIVIAVAYAAYRIKTSHGKRRFGKSLLGDEPEEEKWWVKDRDAQEKQ